MIQPSTKAKQRAALFALLLLTPVSTIEAREQLGISHPAGRIAELRQLGHSIATLSKTEFDVQGRPHLCAVDILQLPLDLPLDLEGGAT